MLLTALLAHLLGQLSTNLLHCTKPLQHHRCFIALVNNYVKPQHFCCFIALVNNYVKPQHGCCFIALVNKYVKPQHRCCFIALVNNILYCFIALVYHLLHCILVSNNICFTICSLSSCRVSLKFGHCHNCFHLAFSRLFFN